MYISIVFHFCMCCTCLHIYRVSGLTYKNTISYSTYRSISIINACLCAVLPSIYSSSNTVVVSLQVILAIGMLTAHITDDTTLCFVFLVFLLLAGTVVVGIIIVLCLIMLWYIRKRKMTCRHQNKVLTVS